MYFAKIKGMNEVYTQWELHTRSLRKSLVSLRINNEEIMKIKKELSVYNFFLKAQEENLTKIWEDKSLDIYNTY